MIVNGSCECVVGVGVSVGYVVVYLVVAVALLVFACVYYVVEMYDISGGVDVVGTVLLLLLHVLLW